MHIASELACRVARQAGGSVHLIVIGLCVVTAAAVLGGAAIVDLLQPRPEEVLVAPLRWY